MKKLMLVLAVVVVLVSMTALSSVAADRGQYLVTLKTAPMSFGSVEYTAKFSWFEMTGYSQKWAYPMNLKYRTVTGYAGYVSDWSDESRYFAGAKYATAPGTNFLGNFSILSDNTFIFNDEATDLFSWSTVEYNFSVDGKPLYAGPHLELVRQDGVARAWGGAHIGSPDLVELGAYYRTTDDWTVRFALTAIINWAIL